MSQDGRVSVGVYAGSFDPVHLGHVGVIEDASRLLDHLYVVVAGNPAKGIWLFSLDDRRRLVDASIAHVPNVNVVTYPGLVVEFAASVGADVLIRAAGKERDREWAMSETNLALAGVRTVFMAPRPATRCISSRLIRGMVRDRGAGSVGDLVPPAVARALADL